MNQPVPVQVFKSPLEAQAHAYVDEAYETLALKPGFIVRPQQLTLSKAVASSCITTRPLAAEAPTGTGKTIAYLIGLLAARSVQPEALKRTAVVATATKALQSQLMTKDLVTLVDAGLVALKDVALAKGKGNYFCITGAQSTLNVLEGPPEDLYTMEGVAHIQPETVRAMLDSVENSSWDGDFDNWRGELVKDRRPLAVNDDTCNGRKCGSYRECAFFAARQKMEGSTILVSNHDMVLMDLMLFADEGQGTLPAADYHLVLDEGHHFPDKAISVGAREFEIGAVDRVMKKVVGLARIIEQSLTLKGLFLGLKVDTSKLDRKHLDETLKELADLLKKQPVHAETLQHRYPKGIIPDDILTVMLGVLAAEQPIRQTLGEIRQAVRELKGKGEKAIDDKLVEIARRAQEALQVLKPMHEALELMLSMKRVVKWMFRKDDTISMHCSPLDSADVLQPLLWDSKRAYSTTFVSATLRDVHGFTRFVSRTGMPKNGVTMATAWTFDYPASQLIVKAMHATPKYDERAAYERELQRKLPDALDPNEGSLVLFPSWRLLKIFVPLLRARFGTHAVQVQGEEALPVLRERHENRISAGQGSIMAGTATLAEGMDLPGDLCTHVAILSIPFAAPNNPVEQELNELLGRDYFTKISMPDAQTKLCQMVGRLLRRESDRGRVSIFDRRLSSTQYGRTMLSQLPPFKKVIEALEA